MKNRKLYKKLLVFRMICQSWKLTLFPLCLFLISLGLHLNKWISLQTPDPTWVSPQDSLGEIVDLEDLPIRDYFRMLQKPTGVCRKLVRIGGTLVCRKKQHKTPILDGDKLICVDPDMKMFSSPKTDDCTVLSFGIETDTSFDESVRDANCQVHMFDIWNYDPSLNDTFMTFHKIGLRHKSEYIYTPTHNLTVEMNTLDYILDRFKLSSKMINILKIDIEGDEWKVLPYLISNNLLDSIGQIAVEVHADKAINTTKPLAEKAIREFSSILLDLEKAGFRRVVYWANERALYMKDEKGDKHKHAGELLLVNSNWYKKKFRKKITP